MSEDKTTPAKAEGAPAARTELYRQAEQHLQSAGLRILDRDWRCPAGRLSIVAADNRVLVVCDVRTRTGQRRRDLTGSMKPARRGKLKRLAVRWVIAHGVLFDELRVDVVYLLAGPDGAISIKHLPGAG